MTATESKVPFFLLWRFVRRSNGAAATLTVILMAVAFINLVFVPSLFNGIVRGTNDQFIDAYVGHVTVGPPHGSEVIDGAGALLARIEGTPGVVGASMQTALLGAMRLRDATVTRQIVAIDPPAEATVTNVSRKMVEGSYLKPDDTDGIMLGAQIAGGPELEEGSTDFKHARTGDTVMLSVGGARRQFTVRGIFRTRLIVADERAFITRRALAQLNPGAKDAATMIIVRASTSSDERSLIDALKQQGVTGTFGTWQDSAGMMKSVIKSFRSIDVLISSVALLIAAATIFIVIYIDIVNRRFQIGVLRAIGIKPWIVRSTYVLQSGVYASAGVLLGGAIFLGALVPYFHRHPFSLPICDAVLIIDASDLALRAARVVGVAILSGLIPAIAVTRMKILDAMLGK